MMDVRSMTSSVRDVYAKLQDDVSRDIFIQRLRYCLDGDAGHLYDMLEKLSWLQAGLGNTLESLVHAGKEAVLYGCGARAADVHHIVQRMGNRVLCFCDDNPEKQKTTCCGLPVISTAELLAQHKSSTIVISSLAYADRIYDFLMGNGFDQRYVVKPYMSPQYFGLDFLPPVPGEVYIDVGPMDGGTLVGFQEWCGGKYAKIYAMEPDPSNYRAAQGTIARKKIDRVELIHKGAWHCKDVLSFSAMGNGSSSLSDSGSAKIRVAPIDDMVGDGRVTYIKMDVEGAELNALIGAKKTIARDRPRLAICVYHKPEDILELPLFLAQLVPSYRFFLRHHSQFYIETVLYAVS